MFAYVKVEARAKNVSTRVDRLNFKTDHYILVKSASKPVAPFFKRKSSGYVLAKLVRYISIKLWRWFQLSWECYICKIMQSKIHNTSSFKDVRANFLTLIFSANFIYER